MGKYRILWKSCSRWVGTDRTEHDPDEVFETKEEAEAALAKMEADCDLMMDVQAAASEGQGVEGYLEIEADDE